MKLITFVILNLIASPWAWSSTFDCERFLATSKGSMPNEVLTATAERFGTEPVVFEDALGWIAILMDQDQDRFVYQVVEQLENADIMRTDGSPGEVPKNRNSLKYISKPLREESLNNLDFFFGTIRKAFSLGIGDARQWNHSTTVERFNYAEQFKWRAVHVIFFQYKLYKNLLRESGADQSELENESLNLKREFRLSIPESRPLRLLAPKKGYVLFDAVGLRYALAKRLNALKDQSDAAIEREITDYVDRTFINMMDVYYQSRPGLLRKGSYSVIIFLGLGAAAAMFPHNPVLMPHLEHFQDFQNLHPVTDMPKHPVLSPPAAVMIQQLEDIQKTRALNEMEQVVLETLKRSLSEPNTGSNP